MKHSELTENEYVRLHSWLRRTYGNASKCENCDTTTAKRFEWALLKGKKYEFKRENFWQLCKSCHVRYDFDEEWRENMVKNHTVFTWSEEAKQRLRKLHLGKKLKPETVEKMRTARIGRKLSPTHILNMSRALKGKPKRDLWKAVNQYDKQMNFIKQYPSVTLAAKETGTTASNIVSVIKGRFPSAVGFKWTYALNIKQEPK